MISAVRTNKPPSGFTLIEIVMVLAIAAIVMGGAVGMMIYSSDERTLRNTSGEIELLAKRARTTAILNQTPYALEFREGVVRLLPLANAGMDRRKISKNRVEPDPDEIGADSTRQINLEGGVNVLVRRWNSDEWLTTFKEVVHVWRFDPDGLCEPISVRFTLGKSWAEDTYHPLTATISESALEAR
jgi:prepilin-type N-terminal cleavage/methylation domain-containing protein